MRILFATTRGAGHVGPLIPFVRAALRAGHEALVAGPGSAAPLVTRAGLPFVAVGEPPPAETAAAWAPVWSRRTAPGPAHVIQKLFIGLHARAALPGMLALVERVRPDVIVRETLEFSSSLAAERHGIPQVRIGIHLDSRIDADEGLIALGAPALDALRPEAALDPDPAAGAIRRSPVLTLAPPSATEAESAVRRFRDPAAPPRAALPGWGDPALPLVYLSFGSEAPASEHFPAAYREAAEAVAALPARVLVTIGDRRDPADLGPLPASVRVERWVPQAAVMRHASAMVGHGGSGSTLIALAAGVPLALVPLFVDGPANAARVAQLGAGIVAEDPAGAGRAVGELLSNPGYRAAAHAVSREIAALPPVDEAIAALEAIARPAVTAG